MYSAQLTIERIQTAIKHNNTTQKKLSADLEINENTIKRMTDNKGISSFTLARIADYLHVSVDYLLGRDPPAVPVSAPAMDADTARMMLLFSQLSDKARSLLLQTAETFAELEQIDTSEKKVVGLV